MSTNPISGHLRQCHYLADALTDVLCDALALAQTHRLDPHWIQAIDKAINDNDETWRQIGNIATLLKPTASPIPSHEA